MLRNRYRRAYGGEGDPLDALWWLEHPEERSPAGTASPWAELREQRRRLYTATANDDQLARVLALEHRVEALRAAAADALRQALDAHSVAPAVRPPRGRHGPRRAVLGAVGAVATSAVLAVAVLSLPKPHVDRPELARSLQARFPGATPRPADVRLALSGRGSETVSRSVTGSAQLRITTILCRGSGSIQVRLSDRPGDDSGMPCVGGRARLTRLLDEMPRGPFLATVTVTGRAAWSVTVTDEDVRFDDRTYPRCIGAECA